MLKRSLGLKIALAFLLVGFLPFLTASLTTFFQTKNVNKRLIEENLSNLLTEVGVEVERTIFSAYANIKSLSENLILKSSQSPLDSKLYEMQKTQDFYRVFEDITLINLDGIVLTSTTYNYRGEWRYKEWFKQAKAGVVSISYAHPILNPFKLIIVATAPVIGNDGNVASILAGQIHMQNIWDVTDKVKIGKTGFIFITDKEGNIITHPDKSLLLHKFPSQEINDRILKNEHGTFEYKDSPKISKICHYRLLHGYQDYKGLNWRIGIIQNTDEAYVILNNLQKKIAMGTIFGLVLIGLFSVLLSGNIIKPVQELVKATQRISTGDLNIRVHLKSYDEIGDLGNAFNKMVSDLRISRDELVSAKDYIESIVTSMFDALIVTDAALVIKTVNKATLELLQYKKEELIGKPIATVITNPVETEELKSFFEKETIKSREINYKTKRGKEVPVLFSSSIIRNKGQDVSSIVCTAFDITERKKIERAQRLTKLGELVADMAHEVNNPLMVISGEAQLIMMEIEGFKDEKLKEGLEIIINQCSQAKDITQRLLKFSKPSTGKLEDADINKSLDFVIQIVEHTFSLSNIKIIKKFTPSLPLVKIDEKQMQEVFINLLKNAAEAMPKGGTITVLTYPERDGIRIDFNDTGMGMSEEVKAKMFDPFFTTKEKGTGLGVPVCYGIVSAHGGELRYESKLNEGTTASIFLPANPVREFSS